MPKIKELECSRCGATASAETPQTVCAKCAGAFYVRYDLRAMRGYEGREQIARDAGSRGLDSENTPIRRSTFPGGWAGMWRYRAVLPEVAPVTLGEGWTPVIRSKRYPNVFVKEEGANPTGSFKARGLALAVTMAKHYGLKKLAVPSAAESRGASWADTAGSGRVETKNI